MAQISKKPLDKDIENQMYKQFWSSLSKIENQEIAAQFFSDLLTETEKVVLAKRFAIAILLVRGKTASAIKETLKVTYSTIGSVASWVKNARPKTKELLTSISKEKDWEKILDRIDEILDKLPPTYGRNWSEIGKQRWQRTKERAAKRSLR